MDIKGCTVREVPTEEFNKPYAFEIEDQGGRSMYLATDSAESQDRWRRVLVHGATGKRPEASSGLLKQRRREEMAAMKTSGAKLRTAVKKVVAARAFETVQVASDPETLKAALEFKAKLTKPRTEAERAAASATSSGASTPRGGGGGVQEGKATGGGGSPALPPPPSSPRGSPASTAAAGGASGGAAGAELTLYLQGVPEVGSQLRLVPATGSLDDMSLAWFTYEGDGLPATGTVSPPLPGVTYIEGATGVAYTPTAADAGKRVGASARSALAKTGALVASAEPVAEVDTSVVSVRLAMAPHKHSRYCDRRVRVCTTEGRVREHEVVRAELRGPAADIAKFRVRWWRSDPVPSNVAGGPAEMADLLKGCHFRPVTPRQVADLPPTPKDSEPAPDIQDVKAKLQSTPDMGWAQPPGGITEYPLFPEDLNCLVACDLVPVDDPPPSPTGPAAITGEPWPVWGTVGPPAGSDSRHPAAGGRVCSMPLGPVEPCPPKAREIWIEGDERVGQVLWGRFWYFGGRMGPCRVWWVRIDEEGNTTDVTPPTPLPSPYTPRPSFADACQVAPAEAGSPKIDPCILRLGPADAGCVFKFKVTPVREDGDEGHAESSRPSGPIAPPDAEPRPTRYTQAPELQAAPLQRRVTTSRGKSAPAAPSRKRAPSAPPTKGGGSPVPEPVAEEGGGGADVPPPPAAPAPAPVEDDMLPGWVALDDGEGNTYYFHEESGESRWTKPTADGLPDGWIKMLDEETAAEYFFNTYTGESQWEMPTE